jgi:hypothetical protein
LTEGESPRTGLATRTLGLAYPGAFGKRRSLALGATLEFSIFRPQGLDGGAQVYRNLPPAEWRFKQKIQGYVTYALTEQHEALFQTPALSVAVFAQTSEMAATLKRWTEEVLETTNQTDEGD